MDNMRLFLELGAKTRGLVRGLKDSKGAVRTFASGAKKELAGLRNMFTSVHGKAASLGLSIGAGKILLDSGRLTRSLTKIGQTADADVASVKSLRKELFLMGRVSGKQIENLRDGTNDLVQAGLNLKKARETMKGVNIAMAVTGSDAKALTGGLSVGAKMFDFDLSKPGKALELLDKMTVAGRLGNAELEDLSAIFARVGGNASKANLGFEQTLAFIEALSQSEKDPQRLATLADSTLRVFGNARYVKAAQKASGVKFFDADGSRRHALKVLADIKKKYDTFSTDAAKFGFIDRAFGKADLDTQKGLFNLLKGDSLIAIDRFFEKINTASGTLEKDFSDAISNLPDQVALLRNDLRKAADDFTQPIENSLVKWIKNARASKNQGGWGLDGKDMILGGAGLIGGGLLAARYGGKAVQGLASRFLKDSGNLAAGVAKGKAVEAATGVVPVFVTNWPSGFGGLGDIGGAAANTLRGKNIFGKLKGGAANWVKGAGGLAAVAGSAAGVAGSGLLGYQVGKGANSLGGWVAGKMTDGKYSGSGWLGSMIYDALHRNEAQPVNQNKINLSVTVDRDGRIFTQSDDMNTQVDADVKRGDFGGF